MNPLERNIMGKTFACIATLLVTLGCKAEEDKGASSAKTEATAAVSTAPVLDSKIANAVANAAKAQPSGPAASQDGPPPDGVLGLAKADAELAKGAPPRLKLGGTGSEPRVVLGGADWGDKRPGQLEISVRTGASLLPTTTFKLEVQKPTAPLPGASAGATQYTLAVVAADLATTQPAEIPPEFGAEIRKLKGSQFTVQVAPGGLLGTPSFTIAKAANPQLDTLLQAGAGALTDAVPAYPKEAVGAGAFWMTTSRETLFGADVLAYRMVKVAEVNGDKVVLDIGTKRYLAGETLGLPGLEQSKVHQFQAESSTQMTVGAANALPVDGRSQTSLRGLVEIEGAPRPVQVEARSLFTFAPTVAAK